MAVFGLNGWFGSLFFRSAGYKAKLTEEEKSARDECRVPVTPDAAMQLATVWACVRLLSETIGTLPLGVFRKDAQGRRQADGDHPLYGLLHDSPNADQSAAEFWEACVACICLWGNFYAEIIQTTAGNLSALNFLKGQVAERVMNALSKAMALGKLQGDNLNTVIASGGRLAEALAAGFAREAGR